MTVLFSGNELMNNSPESSGGSLTAVFEGIEPDLLRATPPRRCACARLVMFGGIDIKIAPRPADTLPGDTAVT
ncbi:MAG TPA: hypothetical protein VK923_15310 [Euzebyales bacterium]|nr:hypothetical protein [Euzebyales bacterium]